MPLDKFIQTVLYNPQIGYYTGDRKRVGRARDTDFYTASSMRETFARLVVQSIRTLIPIHCSDHAFVEFGPETGLGILEGCTEHPLKSVMPVYPGSVFDMPGRSVVFSNELFDAQPFRRFICTSGTWRELGVKVGIDSIQWIILPEPSNEESLPPPNREGYVIDWPSGCHQLLESIVQRRWQGLFIAFDYGLDSRTVFDERPQGTARTYSRHVMGTDLLDRPGDVDITHHVIWDKMENILKSSGFSDVRLLRQESFFMQFAQPEIQRILENSPTGFDPRKQSLMELLHPGNMGHKFQVLIGTRCEI